MNQLLFEDEVFLIRGAIFEVHNVMGGGFLEAVYQECLAHEFSERGIEFRERKPLGLTYKEHVLVQTYHPDFVCFDKIIIELKSCSAIVAEHRAQLLNYLKATGLKLGLLVNFGTTAKVQIERVIL